MIRRQGMIFSMTFFALTAAMLHPVHADETGFAGMHNWRKEGGRTCMSDHFHYGSGTGKTKKAALAAAVQSWSSFTAFEYGSSWANFRHAAGKAVSYSAASGGWSADLSARACRS